MTDLKHHFQAAKIPAFAACALLSVTLLLVGILFWSSREVDRISSDRDRKIVERVLINSLDRVARTQESSTVWDEAVLEVKKRPPDFDWIDLNLGVWFHDYAGHDAVYILGARNEPIYAMAGGRRITPSAYREVADTISPILERLRASDSTEQPHSDEIEMLSAGASDLVLFKGKPAIVSAKPIVSDSGDLTQKRGSEAVHISVVFLDSAYLGRLSAQAGLKNARFSRLPEGLLGEASAPIRSRNGEVIGYFLWQAFAPGGSVTAKLAPILILAFFLILIMMIAMSREVYARTFDLEASRAEAQHLAMHDTLTGLPNRALFEDRLKAALAKSRRDGTKVALLTIDLDGFKLINDTLGHPVGDELIRDVSQRITAQVRDYDTVARIGGDEFAVIIVEQDRIAILVEICDRILSVIAAPYDLSGRKSYIGASIGVAYAPRDGQVPEELIRKSDIALYKAKADGRNRFVFFSPALDHAMHDRETTARELRTALRDPEAQLRLLYQPIISTASGQLTSAEALLRWNHPERGLIAPHGFIEMAEQSGLISELGDWVLRTAIQDAMRWPDIRVSVNVSPLQILDAEFPERVLSHLAGAGMAANRLQIEVTESVLMERSDNAAHALSRLRQAGIGIALDDFGTGFSSLSYIRDLAVDRIKIDQSFVSVIDDDKGGKLVEALVSLAHASGLKVTAEGVEKLSQKEFLTRIGCDEVQGFLFSKAIPPQAIMNASRSWMKPETRRRAKAA